MSGKIDNRYTCNNLTGYSTLTMLAMGHPPKSFPPEWRNDKMNVSKKKTDEVFTKGKGCFYNKSFNF